MAKKILIADDESEFVMFLRRKLENMGYEVEESYRGSEVVGKILNEDVDLLILDYAMPDMRGDEVCDHIRETKQLKNLPIILVTAYQNVNERVFRDMGVEDILFKPVDDRELSARLQKYLG